MRLAIVLTLALLVSAVTAGEPQNVGPKLQATSVNIKAKGGYGSAQGSGTIFLVPRHPKKGDRQVAFILTAEHVIDGLREVKTAIVDGKERKVVRYNDAQIVQEVGNENNSRMVGDKSLDAKVRSVDPTRDIALLQVRAVGEFTESGEFCTEEVHVAGTKIFHCGAPGGSDLGGSASLTAGIVSRTGVRIADFGGSEEGVFDQLDCSGLGGSSGGMVCLQDGGEWVGMITLGLNGGDSFHWMVPVRSVREWAKEAGTEWLLDPNGKLPSDAELDEIPLEVAAGITGSDEGEDEDQEAAESPQVGHVLFTQPVEVTQKDQPGVQD